jgi:choline dehydrogenase-like flavoprotein
MSIDYDVIIIGTGPGGGTLAYRLAPSGKKILLLEWGDYLPREKDNWSSKAVFIENKYKAKETRKDKDGGPFHLGIHYIQHQWEFEGLWRSATPHAPARFR